jgi:Fe-S-cluster containining protein
MRRSAPIGDDGPDRADTVLLAELDERLRSASTRAGSRLGCRLGCTECCIGPFPITALDARRLRRGLRELAGREPARAQRVGARASEAARFLKEGFAGDGRFQLDEDDGRREAYLTRHGALPCPALDPETGGCDLYELRPMSCRTFGPPVRIGEEDLPPCRLCFTGAPSAEIEACRVEVDPDHLEDEILSELERQAEPTGETLVAFALASEGGHVSS